MQVEPLPDTIKAFHNKTMMIGSHKIIIQQLVPNTMHQLALAVG
jgi:hypothetical protein